MKKILIKNKNNFLYNIFSYKQYIVWFNTYINYMMTKQTEFIHIINNHFLFIDYWYKTIFTNYLFHTHNKLLYLLNNHVLTVHNGLKPRSLHFLISKKKLITQKINCCGEYIFTRHFFSFKQVRPRYTYQINKKKKNRQINKTKKVTKFK